MVHFNRTLQQFRREGLIEYKNGMVNMLHPGRLAAIADFRAPKLEPAAPRIEPHGCHAHDFCARLL